MSGGWSATTQNPFASTWGIDPASTDSRLRETFQGSASSAWPEWAVTTAKVIKVIVCIFLVLPLIWMAGHHVASRCIVPSCVLTTSLERYNQLKEAPEKLPLPASEGWQKTQLVFKVDGYIVNVELARHADYDPKRWTVLTPGLGDSHWNYLPKGEPDYFADKLLNGIQSNALVFRYPGNAPKETVIKTYQVMLEYLEQKHEATHILGYGFSLGSLVQGDALEDYEFKNGVKYSFMKQGAPASLYAGARDGFPYGTLLGALATFFGWNLRSTSSSVRLEEKGIHEIIVTGKGDRFASLATELRAEGVDYKHKTFIDLSGFGHVPYIDEDMIAAVNAAWA